jgi:hypothetical protein
LLLLTSLLLLLLLLLTSLLLLLLLLLTSLLLLLLLLLIPLLLLLIPLQLPPQNPVLCLLVGFDYNHQMVKGSSHPHTPVIQPWQVVPHTIGHLTGTTQPPCSAPTTRVTPSSCCCCCWSPSLA